MSDKILWRQLKEGNHKALESIYRAHFTHLFNYGKRFSNNISTVEDAIQDLFIELWNKRSSLGDTDAIRPYLLVSLRRKIIKSIAHNQRTTNDKEPEEYHFDAVMSIDTVIIEAEQSKEIAQKLNDAMVNLSARQREALYLKYQANMDYDSICDSMGISYQSVRNLVSKAISELSKHMKTIILIFASFL